MTNQEIIENAKKYSSKREWRCGPDSNYQLAAYKRGPDFYAICTAHMVDLPRKKPVRKYSDDEIRASALRYQHRNEWRKAEPNLYFVAAHRDPELFQRATAHMTSDLEKYTDEEIMESAKQFKHKGQWKKFANQHYQTAHFRDESKPGFFDLCTAHMTPALNPYIDGICIYVCEFTDNHAYVGLSCNPEKRQGEHRQAGSPVFEHMLLTGLDFTFKEILWKHPKLAGKAERKWMRKYLKNGWKMLNRCEGGSLGGLTRKWIWSECLAEARKYQSKTEWARASQTSYHAAQKIPGCFAECTAHMPRYKAYNYAIRKGEKRSDAAKEKMRQAKLGRTLTEEHKAKIGQAIRSRTQSRPETTIVPAQSQDWITLPKELVQPSEFPPGTCLACHGNGIQSTSGDTCQVCHGEGVDPEYGITQHHAGDAVLS